MASSHALSGSGVAVHQLRAGLTSSGIGAALQKESGLAGASRVSAGDMRQLRERATNPCRAAPRPLEVFLTGCWQGFGAIGGKLGGVDCRLDGWDRPKKRRHHDQVRTGERWPRLEAFLLGGGSADEGG